jgi:hypothetical protein
MAIIVEVDTYDGEVQSIRPIEAETDDFFSSEELKNIHAFLRYDDDADFEFMQGLNSVIGKAIK